MKKMKYKLIDFDRVVELCKQDKLDKVFYQNKSGELYRIDLKAWCLSSFVSFSKYFELVDLTVPKDE